MYSKVSIASTSEPRSLSLQQMDTITEKSETFIRTMSYLDIEIPTQKERLFWGVSSYFPFWFLSVLFSPLASKCHTLIHNAIIQIYPKHTKSKQGKEDLENSNKFISIPRVMILRKWFLDIWCFDIFIWNYYYFINVTIP